MCSYSCGIEFDTKKLVMRLPIEKLVNLKEKIKVVLRSKKSHTEGHAVPIRTFQFCMQGGCPRYILSQAINSTIWVRKIFHKIRLAIR